MAIVTVNLGFPRIGPRRKLKSAVHSEGADHLSAGIIPLTRMQRPGFGWGVLRLAGGLL